MNDPRQTQSVDEHRQLEEMPTLKKGMGQRGETLSKVTLPSLATLAVVFTTELQRAGFNPADPASHLIPTRW